MDVSAVYVKTPKGLEEMVQRCHGLARRDRQILIMMDGRRTLADIERLVTHPDQAQVVSHLLADGFITLRAQAASTPATAKEPASTTVAPPEDDFKRMDMARNFMIGTLRTFLGASCSSLVDQLDACDHLEQLRAHYAAWREAMALTREGRKDLPDLEKRLASLLS
ncbi:hypothetical protein [Ottowia sp.]|uniref:hypothetical protein n=1 Tax=Ottowia sp. TaxID=1898956 RepID=UPI002C8C9F47|nr:hypothetical protein [Ottowia sp.]HOB67022.1 hypothetical protein [Ottowia sp.]HQD49077.1 hypothetical protein [Ottowia sp.]